MESAKYEKEKNLLLLTVLGRFFHESRSLFLAIRIRTQEIKSDPDPDKRTRIRNTAINK